MGGDCIVKIDKLENGYTVCVVDEDIREKNNDPKNKSWDDPWKSYAFSTAEEVLDFLKSKLDELKPPPDADSEFASAFASDANSDD